MFTLKHITPDGNEALHEAIGVLFIPIEAAGLGQPAYTAKHQLGSLWLTGPDPNAPISEIRDGRVYVMNETGATVANYDLGGWARPAFMESPLETAA